MGERTSARRGIGAALLVLVLAPCALAQSAEDELARWTAALRSPWTLERRAAATRLGAPGVDALAALPALRAALDDPDSGVGARAAYAISRLGLAGERELTQTLAHGRTPRVRAAAASALTNVTLLLRTAQADRATEVRQAAVRHLAEVWRTAPGGRTTGALAQEALISVVATPDLTVAVMAAEALGERWVTVAEPAIRARLLALPANVARADGELALRLASALVDVDPLGPVRALRSSDPERPHVSVPLAARLAIARSLSRELAKSAPTTGAERAVAGCLPLLARDRDARVRRRALDLLVAWVGLAHPVPSVPMCEDLLWVAIERWRADRDAAGLSTLGRGFEQFSLRGPAWVVLQAWWSEALLVGLLFGLWFGAWRWGMRRSPPARPWRLPLGLFALVASLPVFCTPVATALREPWAAYYLPERWVGGLPFTAAALLSVAGCCALGVLWGLLGAGEAERERAAEP